MFVVFVILAVIIVLFVMVVVIVYYRISTSFGGRKGKVGDMTPISIVKLTNALPVDIAEKLGKRVDDCYWGRLLHERLARKSVIESEYNRVGVSAGGGGSSGRLMASPDADIDALTSGLGLGLGLRPRTDSAVSDTQQQQQQQQQSSPLFNRQNSGSSVLTEVSFAIGDAGDAAAMLDRDSSSTSSSVVAAASLVSLNPVDKAIDAFLAMKMEDMDEQGRTIAKPVVISDEDIMLGKQTVKTGAATSIQRLARGADARAIADKRHSAKINNQVKEVLCQDVFVSTAAAVLHNTIYNLLQEASYGEFSLVADPLKYMLLKKDV